MKSSDKKMSIKNEIKLKHRKHVSCKRNKEKACMYSNAVE